MPETVFVILPGDVEELVEEPLPSVGASGPPLTRNADHCEQSLAARLQDYRHLPRFEELLRIFCEQVQEIEDAVWQLALDEVGTAVGVQLDGFGAIVGAGRQGLADVDYRALIRATIRANDSEGTIPDLYSVVTAALSSEAQGLARLRTYPPAGFILTIAGPPPFASTILGGLIIRATSAAVRGITVVSGKPAGTRFRFSAAASFPVQSAATGYAYSATAPAGTGSLTRALEERTS